MKPAAPVLLGRAWLALVAAALVAGLGAPAQPVLYYNCANGLAANNALQRISTNGQDNLSVFAAAGAVQRCTALAVDSLNWKVFSSDALDHSLFSINPDGSGLSSPIPTTDVALSLALDPVNQQVYYAASSATQSGNYIARVNYSGGQPAILFTATGAGANGVQRCTALALDLLHSQIVFADAGAKAIWMVPLAGGSTASLVTNNLPGAPLDVALDVTNSLIYYVTSRATRSGNTVARCAYDGSANQTLFTASTDNGVQRCTALDLDLANGKIYLADAGSNALWTLPVSGAAMAAQVEPRLSPPTVRKVRLFNPSSAFTVTTLADTGFGSLRSAITNVAPSGVVSFSPTLFAQGPATLTVTNVGDTSFGPSAIRVDNQVTVIGPSAGTNGLTIMRGTSAPPMRLFYISSVGSLSLKSLTLSNGLATGYVGGSGYQRGGGGGGSAGLGGAILNQGSLDLEYSAFVGNEALGGNGGDNLEPWSGEGSGGGGGGLAGPGAGTTSGIQGGNGGSPFGGAGGITNQPGLGGDFGGGGGGGGSSATSGDGSGPGGAGGFGGGGGGGGAYNTVGYGGGVGGGGGPGGFGGGGGGGGGGTPDGAGGAPGFGGGVGAGGTVNAEGNLGNGGGGGGGLGGGVFNLAGVVTVTNCTFSGNAAIGGAAGNLGAVAGPGLGYGGGIFNYNGTLQALNATFAFNQADQGGGGIFNLADGEGQTATVSLRNTIVADSLNGAVDYAAATNALGITTNLGNNNLVIANLGFVGSIVTQEDPELTPLAYNGGPTLNHQPSSTSPAIHQGDDSGLPATDQRGYPRIADGKGDGVLRADIGAVENGLFRLEAVPPSAQNPLSSGFQILLTGETNRFYVSEYANGLAGGLPVWVPFSTNPCVSGLISVTDSQAGPSPRFYRAYAVP